MCHDRVTNFGCGHSTNRILIYCQERYRITARPCKLYIQAQNEAPSQITVAQCCRELCCEHAELKYELSCITLTEKIRAFARGERQGPVGQSLESLGAALTQAEKTRNAVKIYHDGCRAWKRGKGEKEGLSPEAQWELSSSSSSGSSGSSWSSS